VRDMNDKKAFVLRNPDFPFPMSYPTRILVHAAIILAVINLLVFYWIEKLSLHLVLEVALLEIVVIAVAMAFWASPYKLKW
jgi:hypothetical protein